MHEFEKERELRLSAKEKINKIEGLQENVGLLDNLLEGETKVSKLSTDLEYKKIETLHNNTALESKIIKLEITLEKIDGIKNSVL